MKKRNKDISLMEQIELENKKQEQQKLMMTQLLLKFLTLLKILRREKQNQKTL